MVLKCSICKASGHTDGQCSLLNSPYDIHGCKGKMKIRVSTKPHSLNRRFLRCNTPTCDSFRWVDEDETVGGTPPNKRACFSCGDPSHFVRDCPLQCAQCRRCGENCRVLTSKQPHSYGRRFVSCSKPGCRFFEWKDPATPTKSMARQGEAEHGESSSHEGHKGSVEVKITLEGKSAVDIKFNIGNVDNVVKGMDKLHM